MVQPTAIPNNIVDSTMLTTSSSGSHDEEEVWQGEKEVEKASTPNDWQIEEEINDDHIYIAAKFMSDEVS